MSARPAVSIVMPVRDAARTLRSCLASILAQTLNDWELIAIDDHSADESRELLQAAACTDARIRVLDNPGRGIVAALNTGLDQARAELVARMDADDLMVPQRLARQCAQMQADPSLSVLGCRVEQFPRATRGSREYLGWQNRCTTPADIEQEIFVEAPFAHPAVMLRRPRIVEAGAYRDGDFPEDYELWLRLHRRGDRMAKLASRLLYWRDLPTRLSRCDRRYRREAFDRLRARYLARDPRLQRNRQRLVIWGAGRRTRQRTRSLLAHGYTPQAWIDIDTRKIGNRLNGVPVHAPGWLTGRDVFVLGYVAAHGARDNIAAWLGQRGFRRGRDYLMVG